MWRLPLHKSQVVINRLRHALLSPELASNSVCSRGWHRGPNSAASVSQARDSKRHAWFIPEFRKAASQVWGLHVWLPWLALPAEFLSSRHFQIHKCQKRIFPVLYKHVNKAKVTWQGNLFLCRRCAALQKWKSKHTGAESSLSFYSNVVVSVSSHWWGLGLTIWYNWLIHNLCKALGCDSVRPQECSEFGQTCM